MYVTLTDLQNGEPVYLNRSLSGGLEVVLCELTYYHQLYNISAAQKNNQILNGPTTIPDGYYNVCELNEFFQLFDAELTLHTPTGRLQLSTVKHLRLPLMFNSRLAKLDVGDKYATGVPKIKKIRGRENIAVGTWNVRTLRPAGKLEQLTHTMSRYHWNIVGLCEVFWKNFGEMSTDDGHKVYFSGEEGKHEYGVGFLVHKDEVGAVLGCQPVSSRLISIRLRAAPFNITIIQVCAPTSGHDDSEGDHFYQELQETIDQTPKKDILVVQGDWNAKVGKDAQADWGKVCGPYCNVETNERGLKLLEFATFNNLVLTNTLGPHKPSRRWTWHSPNGKHHNQIDYILVKKRIRSGVNIHRTRSFPGADIGSDHDLVMMTFQVRLKMAREPNQLRLRFDLEKLRNPDVACTFQATIDGKFAPLIGLSDEDMDMDTMITTYNTAVTDAACEILGKERRRKKPWVTKDVLYLCDEERFEDEVV